MKKKSSERTAAKDDDLEIPELPDSFFRTAVRGKYHAGMMARSNVVRIAPDLVKDFQAVNEALRLAQQIRQLGKPSRRKKTA